MISRTVALDPPSLGSIILLLHEMNRPCGPLIVLRLYQAKACSIPGYPGLSFTEIAVITSISDQECLILAMPRNRKANE